MKLQPSQKPLPNHRNNQPGDQKVKGLVADCSPFPQSQDNENLNLNRCAVLTSVYCWITFSGVGPRNMQKSRIPPMVLNVKEGNGLRVTSGENKAKQKISPNNISGRVHYFNIATIVAGYYQALFIVLIASECLPGFSNSVCSVFFSEEFIKSVTHTHTHTHK